MSTRQFNVELPGDLIKAVKIDCVKLGVSLTDYTHEALKNFRSFPMADLNARFERQRKRTGRKIAV